MGHDRKASVAVVGGGIGGLAAAAFLRRAGLDATVYEQTPRLGDVGAGLVVAPNAARLLRRLPSAVTLEQVGVVLEAGWEFRRWADGTVLFAQQLGERSPRADPLSHNDWIYAYDAEQAVRTELSPLCGRRAVRSTRGGSRRPNARPWPRWWREDVLSHGESGLGRARQVRSTCRISAG